MLKHGQTCPNIARTELIVGVGLLLATATSCASARHTNPPPALAASAVPAPPPGRADIFVPEVPAPDPSTSSEVSLARLLAYADQHAPAIRVARARSRRGDAEVEAASLILQSNPEIEAGVGRRAIGPATFFEAEASIQQRIEIAGERGLRVETAERTREVALSEQDEARWLVHAAVHTLFLDSLIARERVGAAERVVRFSEELQHVAQRRVDAGDDAPLAMLVVRADLAQARERLIAAQLEEKAALLVLAEAVGWPADRPLTPKGTLPPVRAARPVSDLVRLAAQRHPALRTQALAVAEAESRTRLEAREAWPEPTVGFAYAREGGESPAPDIGLFTVGLPLPFWNRNQGERARASVALDTARAEQAALGVRLQNRIARAAAAVNAAAQRIKIYGADVIPAVERNLELIRRAYDLGEIDIHDVSQTRERVLDAQSRVIDARSEYSRALADLEAQVGTELDDVAVQETTP